MLERADRLSEADLLDLYGRLVAELEGVPIGQTRADRRLQARVDALRALASVRDELGLRTDERLTVRAFNEAAPGRVPGWNASRVVRAWGSWRNATDVLAGAKPPRRAEREAVMLVRGFNRSSRRPPLDGLLEWLDTKPAKLNNAAYDEWARARNAELGPREPRYLLAGGVTFAMSVNGFAEARRHAEAVLDDADPPPPEGYEAAGRTLVRFADLAREFSMHRATFTLRVRETPLPEPALHHAGRTFWLREDCELWAKGETVERRGGELDATVFDWQRLAVKLGINPQTARDRMMHHQHLLPEPAGELGGRLWWHAAAVERWQADAATRPAREREQEDDRVVLDGRTLLTTTAARDVLGITSRVFEKRVRQHRWQPAARFGRANLWLLDDIEAWKEAPDAVRERCDLRHLLLTGTQVARLYGVGHSVLYGGVKRGMAKYPPRDGTISGQAWWDAGRVARWRAEHEDDG
ncbi:hypothetical protein [Baekduia sp. Peel2402]|uniref:hypothetical protein n=1 Tax=Baekduia sp. Peel2402 TaxID=3458296 RepID=UPI00403E3D30